MCYHAEMMQDIKIRFEPEQVAALDALSTKYGLRLAQMVRWCVTNSLPKLTANLEASTKKKVPSSTIDINPGA